MDWKRSSERRDTEQVLVKAAEAERGPAQKGQTVEKTRKGWPRRHTSSPVTQDSVCSALGCDNVDILKEGTKERPCLTRQIGESSPLVGWAGSKGVGFGVSAQLPRVLRLCSSARSKVFRMSQQCHLPDGWSGHNMLLQAGFHW